MDFSFSTSLHTGTSGLLTPIPKREFPPQFQDKSRLTYYASLFNSIEINSSFYKVPMASTMRKWAESVPDDFQFTFKLWKEITHTRGLLFKQEDLDNFIEVISCVGDKMGCLLVQFPPSINVQHIHQLEKLLFGLKIADPLKRWKVAVEFRNRSWYEENVYELLDAHQAAMVFQDLPASSGPLIETAEFIYLRFHGPNGGYRGSYPDDFLSEYAGYIKDWQEDGKDVYAYFNNTMGEAVKNLITLNGFVKAAAES